MDLEDGAVGRQCQRGLAVEDGAVDGAVHVAVAHDLVQLGTLRAEHGVPGQGGLAGRVVGAAAAAVP